MPAPASQAWPEQAGVPQGPGPQEHSPGKEYMSSEMTSSSGGSFRSVQQLPLIPPAVSWQAWLQKPRSALMLPQPSFA